jgi:hypothetical protein
VIRDLVDQIFGGEEESPDDYYPGSKRKKSAAPAKPSVEFIPDPWRERFSIKQINGVDTKMYAIGAIADAMGVSTSTIRHWTRKGYLPLAPYRLPSNMIVKGEKVAGRRLYTEPLIDAAVAAFEKRGLLGKPRIEWSLHSDLPIEIREEWTRIVKRTNQPTTK